MSLEISRASVSPIITQDFPSRQDVVNSFFCRISLHSKEKAPFLLKSFSLRQRTRYNTFPSKTTSCQTSSLSLSLLFSSYHLHILFLREDLLSLQPYVCNNFWLLFILLRISIGIASQDKFQNRTRNWQEAVFLFVLLSSHALGYSRFDNNTLRFEQESINCRDALFKIVNRRLSRSGWHVIFKKEQLWH